MQHYELIFPASEYLEQAVQNHKLFNALPRGLTLSIPTIVDYLIKHINSLLEVFGISDYKVVSPFSCEIVGIAQINVPNAIVEQFEKLHLFSNSDIDYFDDSTSPDPININLQRNNFAIWRSPTAVLDWQGPSNNQEPINCQHPGAAEIERHFANNQPHDWSQRMVQPPKDCVFKPNDCIIAVLDTGARRNAESINDSLSWLEKMYKNGKISTKPSLTVAGIDADEGWPEDYHGHGTNLAWLIGGTEVSLDGASVAGVYPGVKVLPVRVSLSTQTSAVSLAQGICVAQMFGASIFVSTFTSTRHSVALALTLQQLFNDQNILLTSVGNCLHDKFLYPGHYDTVPIQPRIISVGACYPDKCQAWLSNKKSHASVYAPGARVIIPSENAINYGNGFPVAVSGTSYAPAYVAGALGKICDSCGEGPATAFNRVVKLMKPVPGITSNAVVFSFDGVSCCNNH